MAYHIGVDVGSVSVNCVVLDESETIVHEAPYRRHFGLVLDETARVLEDILARFPREQVQSISFTGNQGQAISELLGAPFEVETIAQVLGATKVAPGVRSIISIGGQDAALFELDYDQQGQWRLAAFNVNGPCASGTGSFIDQQAERLTFAMYGEQFDMNQEKLQKVLEDFIALGATSTYPAPVACRCTVFTKSDMIHLQNKGETLPNIIAGLHHGTAANYMSTIVANRELVEPVIFIGGMASNRLQVEAFRKYYPNLTVPEHHASLGALGSALQSLRGKIKSSIDLGLLRSPAASTVDAIGRAKPLSLEYTDFDPDNTLPPLPEGDEVLDAYLGVDIGSTSTKYALIDDQGRIIHKRYVPTQGKPIEVAQGLLRHLQAEVGPRVRLKAVATTGSGRNVVGDFISSDLVIDEITAHARGAVAVDPEIDTIFEIGGQDSKYIAIDKTHPTDFMMNKVCAAGTGSFLHELANKMNINIIGEFQEVALSAKNPVNLAERCTVFMESDLTAYAQKGAGREDLIAGLCYAIVRNYLHRVVENRRIGQRIMFLGGPSLNKGIVAAFEKVVDKPILVPRHREVMGAFGAALAVRELARAGKVEEKQRDLEHLAGLEVAFKESICRADKNCHNECKLKIYNFGGRKSVWGGDCGRYETTLAAVRKETDYFQLRWNLFRDAVQEAGAHLGEGRPHKDDRPLIGVPLSLHSLDWGVFWAHLLTGMGLRPVFSPPTTQAMAMAGVESMTAEMCFPVKVFHGHVHHLLEHADYLFLPNVINMATADPEEKGQFCPLVESSQYLVRAALRIDNERIIRPTLFLKDGPEMLVDAVYDSLCPILPRALLPAKPVVVRALHRAWDEQHKFKADLRRRGREILSQVNDDESVWIVTGRPYNLYDERLNLQMGRQMAKLGIKALPLDFLDVDDESLEDFPRMYWGLGARILRATKKIARTPNWFGMHLTNFSCGPDSFIEHFYGHVLSDKPFLILELDEHSAVAGMLTRIEAFQNVVKNVRAASKAAGKKEDAA
ncbi:acyl-CoA dehydratase activase [Desulfonatronum sp. SC1]|uniref:acyl-CoA dehydratase activase n=1 Tax=Desulfonatronum sp. SC1 TaxID=2109626 RepID=UPI000D2FF714|nr:acyl-CoA dehydratase activase [Desulfonatronum sp. SC1]PTN31693.1 CoA activase [Desulfonatronum sp. SC1]